MHPRRGRPTTTIKLMTHYTFCPALCVVPYRFSTKPFYRQLYRGLKEIDTLEVVDEITASIMY